MGSKDTVWHNFKWIWLIFAVVGVVVGLGAYTLYASRAWVYLTDDPRACATCHVMGTYYSSYAKSSHNVRANCNDCHVPQDKFLRTWAFKAKDGLYHASVFTFGEDRQVIRAREGTKEVVQENCVRCHVPLVTEFAKMSPEYDRVLAGDKKACWDCHRDMPHTQISSPSSTPSGSMPLPGVPVPAWLQAMTGAKRQ
ncbi:MAG: cytochrome c nitrite reductase small subunit [Deltaproteobacteria bacterium]|jgi:cytochrome c nitrite reductase small subunit|nr:cytochrome c nitrite reductase small subunit [Deltaproteobacteria bacterium]